MHLHVTVLLTLSILVGGCASAAKAPVDPSALADPDGEDLEVKWPDLRQTEWLRQGRDTSADRAVVVSIENYTYSARVGRIPGALENGQAWEQFFVRAQGMQSGSQVRWLYEGDATKESIDEAVDEAVRATEVSGGRLWFVFIGHGTELGNHQGVLLGVDVQPTARSAGDRGVSTPKLLAKLRHLRRATVVFDTCFAGPLLNGFEFHAGTQGLEPFEDGLPGNVSVFSAAGDSERAGQLSRGKRPAYSYLLLGALSGWGDSDHNKSITESSVEAAISRFMWPSSSLYDEWCARMPTCDS